MRKLLIIPVLLLAACGRDANTPTQAPHEENYGEGVQVVMQHQWFRVLKKCDGTRLVYVAVNYNEPGGISTIENAPECKKD